MLRVDAKHGSPKDGNSSLELFQVEIYPLKIHLTETMYRMIWEFFFPEEEQDSQRRREVWKVSTTAGSKRVNKGALIQEAPASRSHGTKQTELPLKSTALTSSTTQPLLLADFAQEWPLELEVLWHTGLWMLFLVPEPFSMKLWLLRQLQPQQHPPQTALVALMHAVFTPRHSKIYGGDLNKCQFYMDMLTECSKNSRGMLRV